ncbi:MAG: hypothetical protein JXR75_09535 [Rhodobacteraceae bacterium]|nr:hypothetical protein [Paracoccaceae bacterium]
MSAQMLDGRATLGRALGHGVVCVLAVLPVGVAWVHPSAKNSAMQGM